MFELSGTVKEIFDTQTFGSGFQKREFVVTTQDSKYPQDIKFELMKDKISLIDGVGKGDGVTVSFDIRGREWKGNYYVNLAAWKIQSGASSGGGSDDGPPLDHYDRNAESEEDETAPF